MNVEVFCQMYLDDIAFKHSTYYIFKQKSKAGGDVLETIKSAQKARWSHLLETTTYMKEGEKVN